MVQNLHRIAGTFALAGLLAACNGFGNADDLSAAKEQSTAKRRVAPEDWRAQLSQPRFTEISSEVIYITAVDGTQLSLTLHRPVGAEGEKLPTLMQMTPYQAFLNPRTEADPPSSDWADFVLRGAAYVEADERGSTGSDGCLDFGGSLDRSDAVVFADWIRAQAWSNGLIVTDGISHPGMGSVVAHAAIPGLTAALAHAPVVSYYQDEWLQGAKFEDQFNGPLYEAVEAGPPLYLTPEAVRAQPAATCRGQTTLAYSALEGTFTAFWEDKHLARHNQQALAAPVPILLTHGFVDLNVHPDHTQMYWDSLPADYPKSLIMGYWYHGWPDMSFHPFESFADLRHRWLDATLFGAQNGLDAEPKVLVQDSQGTWHESETWPLTPSQEITLTTSAADSLLAASAPAVPGEARYTDTPGAVRGEWTDAHVAFRSEPLDTAMLVNGAPKVHLVASSSAAETKWVAWLMDEAPDGSWQRISHGYIDSHQWAGEDQWQALTPGTPYTYELQLQPTAVVVDPGHRITLLITSQDSRRVQDGASMYCFQDGRGGCYNPSGILPATTVGRAQNTVLTGPGGTSVRFYGVDPELTAKPPF